MRSTRRLGRAALERLRSTASRRCLSTLLQVGFALPPLSPGARWSLTPPFHPYRCKAPAVCSLWHFPADHSGSALPTTLPCGARTFLGHRARQRTVSVDAAARPTRPARMVPTPAVGSPLVWALAAVAGLLAVLTTALPWHDAVTTTQRVAPVLGFLVGVTVLAELADIAGLFELAARRVIPLARGSTRLLLLLVCALATGTTVLLSLDTTAVLITPVVLAVVVAIDADPLPFAYATVWLANAASLLLPVSNLTNLLALDRLGTLGNAGFARRMLLPEVAAVSVVVVVLLLRFRHPLSREHQRPAPFPVGDRALLAVAALCCLAVAPAALAGLPPWQAAVPAALVLGVAFVLRERRSVLRWSLLPWRVVLLTEGLFLVVAAAGKHGLDRLLDHAAGHGVVRTELVGAAASNLVNNLPSYLALERVVPPGHQQQLLGLLLGTNAGSMLVVTGSLATILWRERCRARGLEIPAGQFLRLGLLLTPPLLVATYLGLVVS